MAKASKRQHILLSTDNYRDPEVRKDDRRRDEAGRWVLLFILVTILVLSLYRQVN